MNQKIRSLHRDQKVRILGIVAAMLLLVLSPTFLHSQIVHTLAWGNPGP
jgi:hypothetical protein